VRHSCVSLASSVCLAVLISVIGIGPNAFGAGSGRSDQPAAVPSGFHAQSMSWVTPKRGWMLGSAPCGQATCTTVIGTNDTGVTWRKLATLDAPITFEQPTGVTEIRFADGLHGWAYEPALWATSDGGATWQRQAPPGGGHLVLSLAADADTAYAIVSPCRLNRICGNPPTVWRTTPGQGSWTQVDLSLPVFVGFDLAFLAVHGAVAYLGVPAALIAQGAPLSADILYVTLDGEQWSSLPDPCDPGNGETLSGIAAISDTQVALMCQGNIGFGKAVKRAYRSNDNGQTFRSAGAMPLMGIVSQMAAAPNGTLAVSSYSDGSWIYRNAGGQGWTTPVSLADLGMGWNNIVFLTNQLGFVIHGPWAFCCQGGPGELWQTVDGGVTWAPMTTS
jgi:photosystem II stability/assembly factor-like uncharacterized protein